MQAKDIPEIAVLEACAAFHSEGGLPPWRRLLLHGYPEKVIYAKMEKLDRRGLLEYGVSLRTAWLTGAGLDRLQSLRRST